MKKFKVTSNKEKRKIWRTVFLAVKVCGFVVVLVVAVKFVVLICMNAYDLYSFQKTMDEGRAGKTLHYLEWSEDGELLTEKSFTMDLTPEQQSEVREYLNLMTKGGHLTFRRQNLRNQVRIQLTNPTSPYFYREQYSPDTRLFLRSGNYEEGFAKLLDMVNRAKEDLEGDFGNEQLKKVS